MNLWPEGIIGVVGGRDGDRGWGANVEEWRGFQFGLRKGIISTGKVSLGIVSCTGVAVEWCAADLLHRII